MNVNEIETPEDFPRNHVEIGRTGHGWAMRIVHGNTTTTRFFGTWSVLSMTLDDWMAQQGDVGQ